LIPIGYDSFIERGRVLAISPADGSSSKRLRREAAERKLLIDTTGGRRTRSLVVMDTGHVVLSALQPETIRARLDKRARNKEKEPGFSEKREFGET